MALFWDGDGGWLLGTGYWALGTCPWMLDAAHIFAELMSPTSVLRPPFSAIFVIHL